MAYMDNVNSHFQNMGLTDRRDDYAGHRDYQQSPAHGPPPPGNYYGAPQNASPINPYDAHPQGSYPPPPTYQPPSDKPPIPHGWTPIFDQQNQRWYYFEAATGQSQWEAPGYHAPPPLPMHSYPPGGDRDYGDQSGYQNPYGHGDAEARADNEGKKGSGKGGIILGAAGGLAAGAVLGAVLHDSGSDSGSDHGDRYAQQPQNVYISETNNYYPESSDAYQRPPDVLPATDADGNSVSSSDRESVQEARERYEEALADAASSDASSSDREELEEAREEYYEEYEDTYGDDD